MCNTSFSLDFKLKNQFIIFLLIQGHPQGQIQFKVFKKYIPRSKM